MSEPAAPTSPLQPPEPQRQSERASPDSRQSAGDDPDIRISRAERGYVLEAAARIAVPIERVFEFFCNAGNLQQLTPDWLHFEIATPRPIEMRAGTVIGYRLRLRGIPLRWRSEITVWEPPLRFVDEQRRGPYRWWRHEHHFESVPGGTLARDRVEYGVLGGGLVNRLLVAPDFAPNLRVPRHRAARDTGGAAVAAPAGARIWTTRVRAQD